MPTNKVYILDFCDIKLIISKMNYILYYITLHNIY